MVQIFLKGERIISSLKVWIPKYEVPIFAEIKKKIETKRIERKINIQDCVSNILTMFHVGANLAGYLVNQYCGK